MRSQISTVDSAGPIAEGMINQHGQRKEKYSQVQ